MGGMPKTARRKGGKNKKYFEKAKRREHDRALNEIYMQPEVLGIDGLNNDSILFREREYKYKHNLGKPNEVFLDGSTDVLFFWDDGTAYRFMSIEVKSNIYDSISANTSYDQLMRALNYFKGMWWAVIRNQVRPLMSGTARDYPVLLDVLEVCPEVSIDAKYSVFYFREDVLLGIMHPNKQLYSGR